MAFKVEGKRKRIFQLFLYNERLKFSEILSQSKIESNLLAYFLKKMVSEGMLEKRDRVYKLTEKSERLIPFFVRDAEMLSPLVVVLVAVLSEEGKKILLIKRDRRPYKGFWSILSGRLLINESIKEAAARIVLEKAFAKCSVGNVKSVVYERLIEKDKSKHGFVFFLVTANLLNEKNTKEKDYLKWFELNKLHKRNIISSDFWMLKNHLSLNSEVFEETINQSKKTTKMQIVK